MPLKPFLQLRGLKRLRLAALADENLDEHGTTLQNLPALDANGRNYTSESHSGTNLKPLLMDLSPAAALEELDFHFMSSGKGVSAPGGMFEEVQALAPKLHRFRISGLPSDDCHYLRPVLARRLALCKNLKVLELADGIVQEDFLRELYKGLATRSRTPLRGLEMRIPLVTSTSSPNLKVPHGNEAVSVPKANDPLTEQPLEQVIADMSNLLERNSGCLHIGQFATESPDLRVNYSDNRIGAADMRRVTQGLSSYGQGAKWWIKGGGPVNARLEQKGLFHGSKANVGIFGFKFA